MPRRPSTSPGKPHTRSLGEIDRPIDKAFTRPRTPPPVTPIYFPADSDLASVAWEPCSRPHLSSESESGGPATPPDLDRLWDDLRHKKERKLAKYPPKIKSFEETEPPLVKITSSGVLRSASVPLKEAVPLRMEIKTTERPEPSSSSMPTLPAPKHALKRRKSHASFRESQDGRTVTATFDIPGVSKHDVHVSFQRNRLIVTWQTVKVTEKEEGDKIVRERREKKYDRIIPLPDSTKFEEVRASMDGRHLILTYPNIRTAKAEPRGTENRGGTKHRAPEIEHW